ncbi:Dam family site-specific DNA-(adenine-N6)-methyltransferase [Pontibacter sp. SGAir0037]|uniref:DNA adenine methylase n=1 Tax=Pontibacter sp. SGAir0037 TaxID=2571030 RepID=UPI0010CCC93B|nr:Dam family site-specific DNA-(adenine-N6)-methyltransferase [Pontibacter sp. SGAir0037]QCR22851.1 modification methylase [Pontibacter sp. SGAir0037]
MSNNLIKETDIKPFLKWAGGKTQLLPAIETKLIQRLHNKKSIDFIEPFAGSGAVLFFMLRVYGKYIKHAVINDINPVLTDCYKTIRQSPDLLINQLAELEQQYFSFSEEEDRKQLFLEKREEFNCIKDNPIRKSALMIFLNKTCFNGLYRVNSKGNFNVPFGKFAKPNICNASVIRANSAALQRVEILNTDFTATEEYIHEDAFFYFDPPYKPISNTASFNSYAKEGFVDEDQVRLKSFCDLVNGGKAYFVQSNSDTTNNDESNNFFQQLYADYTIERVKAKRAINSKGSGRGEIFELIISNDSVLGDISSIHKAALQTSLF